MIRSILAGAAVVMGMAAAALAGGKEDVQAAAKKLAGESYSWTNTVEGGFASKSEGSILKDGLTMLKMSFGDNSVEIIVQNGKGAIKTQDGWMSLTEAGGDNGAQGPGRFFARTAQTFKSPAKQAEDVAGMTKELTKADDAFSSDLTEEGAKELLAFRRGGNTPPPIKNAKGTAKFWVKDGVLTKAQYHVEGTVTFNNEDRDVNRTTTIEIKEVGTTKIAVPEEAKAKMDK